MNPSVRQQILFKVSLFRFHFVFPLQYLDCYYDKNPVKQTASLNTFFISNLFAKAPGLNLRKKLSNLLSNHDTLN